MNLCLSAMAKLVRKLHLANFIKAGAAISLLAPSLLLAQGTGYWHTKGNQILDANGNTVRIAGVNWYGFETTAGVVHGLYAQDYHVVLGAIEAAGFNSVRLPFSNQMVETPTLPSSIEYSNSTGPINTDLQGLNSIQVMDKIIQAAGQLGLRVILDNHRSEAGDSNEPSGLWYTSAYPESKWISDWTALATRYKSYTDRLGNPTVIGVDLRNEPHLIGNSGFSGACWTGDSDVSGCPTTNTKQNWPAAATRAATAILKVNPSLLIFVEGTDCYSGDCGWQGGDLEGAAKYPIKLPVASQLVYSAHDYGPDLYKQSWFNSKTTAASLATAWNKYWGFLSAGNTAPVWIGEFGTTNTANEVENNTPGSQGQWFGSLVSFLGNHPALQWSYWALNGEDSYGLLDSSYNAIPVSAMKEDLLYSIHFSLVGETAYKPCSAVPPAPAGLTATATSSTAISLKWSAVTPPAGCEVTYRIYRSTAASFTPATGVQIATGLTQTNFADNGLTASTKYNYLAVAVDSNGSSKPSDIAGATTAAGSKALIACHVAYSIVSQWPGGFQGAIAISNTGSSAVTSWALKFTYANGQVIDGVWNTAESQSGATVTMDNLAYNGAIPAGATLSGIGFDATDTATNSVPAAFTLNGTACK